VIIVGGGFGGLSVARALCRAAVRVTLLDKRNYHLFRPMLYQVSTGLLSDDEISGAVAFYPQSSQKMLMCCSMKSPASARGKASFI
jgi:NADH dehydrogenase FAD-containing subunit